MKTKEEVKNKIESILNRYYKETGKEIVSPILVYVVLNNQFNYKYEIKFKEQKVGDELKKWKHRSEEHTSELQSHSFISYAVFCLKKKKNIK